VEIGKEPAPIRAGSQAVQAGEESDRRQDDEEIARQADFSSPRGYGRQVAHAQELTAVVAAPAPVPAAVQGILSAWVAVDPVSVNLLAQVRRAAANRSPLLVYGEPGSGKDLLATLIHYLGPHAQAPLVKLSCATLPEGFLGTELFGSEAVVGAGVMHVTHGRLEIAGAGTVVLHEISALSMPHQERLLRAIEEQRFHRMGGTKFVPMSARVVALTTTDLQRAVARGSFREDLYYRLAVAPLAIPPLRQRVPDIGPMAEHFVRQLCQVHRRAPIALTPEVLDHLQAYAWPGNVSELRDVMARLVLSTSDREASLDGLPAHLRHAAEGQRKMSLEELERSYIAEVLAYTRGKKTAAAGILGISRKTLLEKRKRYGLM
jgi:DNA-binding NtrC family response regulator